MLPVCRLFRLGVHGFKGSFILRGAGLRDFRGFKVQGFGVCGFGLSEFQSLQGLCG